MRNPLRAEQIRPFAFPLIVLALFLCLGLAASSVSASDKTLLNVSFDVSRQLFQDLNPGFVKQWRTKTGEKIIVNQSHAGSTKQANSVIDGLEADVVTLNQEIDIDAIAVQGKLLATNWRTLFPKNSSPFTSTIIFVVRKGNPKKIKDWDDLARPNISVIVPNPKTSGNGRYSYFAAYAFALNKYNGSEIEARKFVGALFKNVPTLNTGGRAATTTFAQHEIGDVLLTFESEALLLARESGSDKFEIVNPSQSIEAEMPVAVVEKYARRHGVEAAARAYLDFLYSDEAQEIIARNFYRPRSESVAAKHADQFGKLKLVTVDEFFGGWAKAQKVHFADGGFFDQIFQPAN